MYPLYSVSRPRSVNLKCIKMHFIHSCCSAVYSSASRGTRKDSDSCHQTFHLGGFPTKYYSCQLTISPQVFTETHPATKGQLPSKASHSFTRCAWHGPGGMDLAVSPQWCPWTTKSRARPGDGMVAWLMTTGPQGPLQSRHHTSSGCSERQPFTSPCLSHCTLGSLSHTTRPAA